MPLDSEHYKYVLFINSTRKYHPEFYEDEEQATENAEKWLEAEDVLSVDVFERKERVNRLDKMDQQQADIAQLVVNELADNGISTRMLESLLDLLPTHVSENIREHIIEDNDDLWAIEFLQQLEELHTYIEKYTSTEPKVR
jgi:hypothetical protein